jgi:AraC family transcriptional regulator, regulatory protein of adaptative response / methylated-DNA-[protein]-cysteine methyltransferase
MIKKITIETPIGEMVAGATKEGLCLLEFADRKSLQSQVDEIAGLLETTFENGSNKNLRMVKKQLKEYFKGKRKEFTIPLLTPGTDFQQSVWKDLLKIPYGSTKTYQEQADLLNNPGSVRAVAHANASNRIAILIPCHRVIGSDGHLIGYGGGLERKRWLLDHERKFSGKPVDLNLFQ